MNQGIKVLVIDDSPFISKAVKKAVEPEGFEVIGQAFNGREGLEMINQSQPEIIILDVTMPVMDGLETAENIYRKNPNAKVIMLSAMGDEKLVESAKRIGVKRFLNKPFKTDEMVAAIKEII
jgi:two-component system chemotaxis response regulator CheY